MRETHIGVKERDQMDFRTSGGKALRTTCIRKLLEVNKPVREHYYWENKPRLKNTFTFLLRFYLFIFREKGREGEREQHQCVVAFLALPTGDLAHNPGMCPGLGIEPALLCFTIHQLIHWAAPAGANTFNSLSYKLAFRLLNSLRSRFQR